MQQSSEICRLESVHVPRLLDICKKSFPGTITWKIGGRLAECWWALVLHSDAVEAWGILEEGLVEAFYVLVTNEKRWAMVRKEGTETQFKRILIILKNPVSVLLIVINRVHAMCYRSRERLVFNREPIPDWGPHMRTWLELIAVTPESRGRGLAQRLLVHCEQRTKVYGRRAVGLRMMAYNSVAKALYQKQGYFVYHSEGQYELYAKSVD